MNRRLSSHFRIRLALAALACLGGGCGPSKPAGETAATPAPVTPAPTAPATGSSVRAAIVLQTGGVDDHAFNAAVVSGLHQAQKELALNDSDAKYIESRDASDYKTNLTNFASQNFDIIFAAGYALQSALGEVAPQFPNSHFAIVDAPAPTDAAGKPMSNCLGLLFREEEGSFLVGYLAASVSKTKKIGFVGGMHIPVSEKVEAGYKAGARTADPNVAVTSTFTGDWNDESKGRSQAEQQFGSGVDIIYQGAGKSGLGVIEATKEKGTGFYVIGTDQNQDDLAPGRVLTTMIKHTDFAVFDTIRRVKAGKFAGGTNVYGIKEGGIGLSDMKFTRQNVPPAVLDKLDKLKQQIVDGKLHPPTTLKELAVFQTPKL